MIDLGKTKKRFVELKDDLGLRSDAGVFEFLEVCYQGSLQIPTAAFETFTKLRKEGK